MGENSSSDDDYMSDKLVAQAEQLCRVGLPLKRTQQREIEMAKRKAELSAAHRTKKRHVIEEEQRNEGLSKPIDPSNKGFALLSKMGFKPGMTLGAVTKTSASGSCYTSFDSSSNSLERLREPVLVKLKTDGRGGLGLATVKEEKAKQRLKAHLGKALQMGDGHVLADEFRKKKRSHFEIRTIRGDLAKSRRVCRLLDLEAGLTEAENKQFWPPTEPNADEDATASKDGDSDEDAPEDEVILRDLTQHLRTRYYYCIWCGCRYCDEDDLAECPGDTREAHNDD
ncbi:coiled-coil domain-containing protein 75-like [Tropilaelaps mercedesae]|uniref:G patch domain-containing protein 11 n=1 Tax=Tropilaelaps mercedesae TaxID=418985 RepID=A0A1V9XVP4_9ACAR|nr:coiled-coil domain-containing protein 75-like [Tropilaelaps mercedesae]